MSDDLTKRLEMKASVMEMGEKIAWGSDTALMRQAAARIRELEAAQGVAVEALEWEDFEGNGAKANAFYQASYLITRWRGRDEFEVALSFPGYQTGYDGERFHKTLEAAKAAAQADYDRRIRSALTPAPVTVEEAARVILDAGCSGVAQLTWYLDREINGGDPDYTPGDAPWPFPDGNEPLCEALRNALRALSGGEEG